MDGLPMFAFDEWADQLKFKGAALVNSGAKVTYWDTRANPGCAANPAFGLDVEVPQRMGSITFWRIGLCDYEIVDMSTEEFLANKYMLDANDETAAALMKRFMSFF